MPFWVYSQDSLYRYKEQSLNFKYKDFEIVGKLITPRESKKNLPVVVFIHGSGPEDYSSSDNYRYLWEEFTKIGFACYSWNRPGVNGSEGKWYEMSIYDRANEVNEAVKALKGAINIDTTQIGFWGISQAGWVIPLAAKVSNPVFVITVSSPATTAFQQELYRVESEMKADEFSKEDIRNALAYCNSLIELINANKPYESFSQLQNAVRNQQWFDYVITGEEPVYKYLSTVLKEDSPPLFTHLNCLVLAIWGENDLVVPPKLSLKKYKKNLHQVKNRNVYLHIIPKADHTLTFNLSGKRAETNSRREKYKNSQKEVFAPGYISLMLDFLKNLNKNIRQ